MDTPLKNYLGWFWFYHSYPLSLPGPGHVTAASADAAFTGNIDGIFGYENNGCKGVAC